MTAVSPHEICPANRAAEQENLDEILRDNPERFRLLPIKYHDLWALYKRQMNSYWVPEEIKLVDDLDDWNNKLNDNERYYIERILAFFAQADGIVNENLILRFMNDVKIPEAQMFYAYQAMMENIHAETYALFIDVYIKDEKRKNHLMNAIDTIPSIKKKALWALEYISSKDATFGERLLAFACLESINFSSAFAGIFYMKKRGLLPGLCQANVLISRDEGLHQTFASMLYRKYLVRGKPSVERAYQIVKESCELEKEFQTDALPVSLIGMNSKAMGDYIEFVADQLLVMCGLEKIYRTPNPFDFMEMISCDSSSNFFECKGVDYQIGLSQRKWDLDEEF